jgi:hypothetical protein
MVTWDDTIYKTKKPARVSVNFEGVRLMMKSTKEMEVNGVCAPSSHHLSHTPFEMDISLDNVVRVKGPIDAMEEETTRG